MPITQDTIIAGGLTTYKYIKATTATPVTFRPISTWSLNGSTGQGTFNTTLNGVTLDSTAGQIAGQIPFTDATLPVVNYLSNFNIVTAINGTFEIYDRLWHNGGITITSTTAQTITSPTWPTRDNNNSSNGEGVLLALEVSATTGAGTPTITVSYTNELGTAGRTGTNILVTSATSPVGSFIPISLQGSDKGVRSVQSITLSATWTSGTINLVAYRPLAGGVLVGNAGTALDPLTGGVSTKCWNGTVPFLACTPGAGTAFTVNSFVQFTQIDPT